MRVSGPKESNLRVRLQLRPSAVHHRLNAFVTKHGGVHAAGRKLTNTLVKIYRDAGYEEPRNAMLRVRRKFRDVYSAPVSISGSLEDIGTHVFTALDFEQGDTKVNWMSVSAEGKRGGTSVDILDRLDIPQKVAADVGKLLTPGTSLTVTDRSFKRNTGLGTDFVVITR